MSAPGPRSLPPLGPTRRLKLPRQAERTLDNGLTVIVVRRPAVPLVELRLWIPFGRAHLARGHLLAQTILSGTETMSSVQIAAELQKIGGGLAAGLDPDRLMFSGTGLATGLDRMLEILAEVLTGASYPAEWVGVERDRLVDGIQVARSQPAHLARTALLKRIYGRHPYAVQTPDPEQVRAVRPGALRSLHAQRVRPAGAVLVLVGDVRPERALDAAEKALGGWQGDGHRGDLPPAPPLAPGPLLLVDRPGSVQSSLRVALPAVPRTHPEHAALQLANLIFGGYFSSRWVENIREDKGYTYGPHSLVEHSVAGSVLVAAAEVATEVTGPALLETTYELGRLATVPPRPEELEQARQYALGTLQLGVSTQAGLASVVSAYAGSGLRLDFLPEHESRLAKASAEDVAEAAARYLAPARAVTVVLGDAERITPSLAALTPIETVPVPS
ncbi:M16 family metallopeptidase [Micromonospora endophytica]|uniref:Insulinase family protein n=1 Tax=Micromonospora endophytica TaxID=515350 RepID=A0A2W2BX06_9ACTN|nr:pitrilysin family protein [Micromonospora endophytica]PZF90130.1 insulinase family protein [Micromonospora endophytica]RIW44654.1 insulinase family protein [Micromonospora endophytica]BCJ60398.1 peptidase M16 [Micromonospora endophytica]